MARAARLARPEMPERSARRSFSAAGRTEGSRRRFSSAAHAAAAATGSDSSARSASATRVAGSGGFGRARRRGALRRGRGRRLLLGPRLGLVHPRTLFLERLAEELLLQGGERVRYPGRRRLRRRGCRLRRGGRFAALLRRARLLDRARPRARFLGALAWVGPLRRRLPSGRRSLAGRRRHRRRFEGRSRRYAGRRPAGSLPLAIADDPLEGRADRGQEQEQVAEPARSDRRLAVVGVQDDDRPIAQEHRVDEDGARCAAETVQHGVGAGDARGDRAEVRALRVDDGLEDPGVARPDRDGPDAIARLLHPQRVVPRHRVVRHGEHRRELEEIAGVAERHEHHLVTVAGGRERGAGVLERPVRRRGSIEDGGRLARAVAALGLLPRDAPRHGIVDRDLHVVEEGLERLRQGCRERLERLGLGRGESWPP